MQISTATRRVYMSILTIMLVFLTTVATTFAWVGILNYTDTSNFELNLQTQDEASPYKLTISATEDGEYSDSADVYEIKKQILVNMGFNDTNLTTREYIDNAFSNVGLFSVTTSNLRDFKELNHKEKKFEDTTSFFKFDLYFKIELKDTSDIFEDAINLNSGLMLSTIESPLVGTIGGASLVNDVAFPSGSIMDQAGFAHFDTNTYLTIDSSYATRLAFEVYSPKDVTESYVDTDLPVVTKIFQGGTQNPYYNTSTGLYSFGGILPEEYNLAYQEYKKKYNLGKDFRIPDEILNRGDLELTEENSVLISEDYKFGIKNGVSNKLKMTVYFWYEGWDADCFDALTGQSVTLNLVFKA
jgi:hypothetical protein